jgi:putative holliday junction resolvase
MLLRPCGVCGSGARPARAWPAATRPVRGPVVRSHARIPFTPAAAGASAPAGAAGAARRARGATPVREGVRLAVDVGSVRVGVARSDPGGLLASPLTVVASGRGELDELARLAASAGAIEVIVGLPTSLSGREGAAAAAARNFAADLARRLAPVPVRLVDERFTTTEAHEALRRGGKDSRARRGIVDAAAAAVLLQAALDAERATGRPPGQLVTEVSA